MKLLFSLLVSLFCTALPAVAQTPVVEWYKVLGSFDGDYAYDIQPTSDGGYIVSGNTENSGGDVNVHFGNRYMNDLWILKLSATGSIQWQRTLGNIYLQHGGYVRQMPDGGYIVGGSTVAPDDPGNASNYSLDYWLVKLKPDGTTAWEKRYGGAKHEYLYAIELTTDGGVILVGDSESYNGDIPGNRGDRDLCVLKVDANGDKQWVKTYGGTGLDRGFSIALAPDGGYFVAGHTESNDGNVSGNHGNHDYWVLKLDQTGSMQWQKCLGGTNLDEAWSVQSSGDGGCIVAGTIRSNDGDVTGLHNVAGGEDWWVVKLDGTGNMQWQKTYGGSFNDQARQIRRMPDGGYVIVGAAESKDGDATCNAGITDMWVVKINSTGTLEWQKSIGGNYYDEAFAVLPFADGSMLVAGSTCSQNITGFHVHNTWEGTCGDYFIVKLSAPGAPPQKTSVTISTDPVCAGQPATLSANARFAGVSPTYVWTRNGVTTGTNSPYLTASDFKNNEVVTCTVTGGGTCELFDEPATASHTVSIKENLSPTVRITASHTQVCSATSVRFAASVENGGTAPEFRWLVNGVEANEKAATFVHPATKAGDVIHCFYSDASGCIAGGKVASNNITIGFSAQPAAAVSIQGPGSPICSGTTTSFNAIAVNAGTDPVFQWKVNNLATGTNSSTFSSAVLTDGDLVTCTVTPGQQTGCSGGNAVTSNAVKVAITGKVTPLVTISAAASEVCAGGEMVFTAVAANAGAQPSYQWQINDNPAGGNSATFRTAMLSNGDVVSCTITADPLFACALTTAAASNRIAVSVKTAEVPTITIMADNNNVCKGTNMVFRASVEAAGSAPSFQWMLNGRPAGNGAFFESSSLSNGDQVYCQVTPAQSVCAVTAAKSNTIVAVVNDQPVLSIVPADTIISAGSSVQLAASVAGTVTRFVWSPVDKLQLPVSLQPTTLALEEPTDFSLLVEGPHGCTATATAKIGVLRQLHMPNGFSPNGDGLNDVFRIPHGVSINLKHFSVYDRWGNLLFTTKNIREGWNGTYGGTPLPTGNYLYLIEGVGSKGPIRFKGNVVLVR